MLKKLNQAKSRAANSVAKAAKERREMEEKFAMEIRQLKKALSDARANLHQQTGALEAKSTALQDDFKLSTRYRAQERRNCC